MNIKYTIDGHFDMLCDICKRRQNGEHEVIRRHYYQSFVAGHVTGIVASIFVDSCYLPYGALEQAMEQISALHCEVSESPDIIAICTCADDFINAAAENKIGILMSFEGAEPITSCQMLHGFYSMGVRGLGLAWSRRNTAADGCDFFGSRKKGGLTDFGMDLVLEAERLSMIVDISHLSDEGVEDVFNRTSFPVVATHSDARKIAGNNRNLTDGQLKELAHRGGLAGLNGCSIIASADTKHPVTQDKLTEHLDYMISVIGDTHIGFGFDFCDLFLSQSSAKDLARMPHASYDIIKGHSEIPSFLNTLEEHGYDNERLEKIAGLNWLNLFKNVLK